MAAPRTEEEEVKQIFFKLEPLAMQLREAFFTYGKNGMSPDEFCTEVLPIAMNPSNTLFGSTDEAKESLHMLHTHVADALTQANVTYDALMAYFSGSVMPDDSTGVCTRKWVPGRCAEEHEPFYALAEARRAGRMCHAADQHAVYVLDDIATVDVAAPEETHTIRKVSTKTWEVQSLPLALRAPALAVDYIGVCRSLAVATSESVCLVDIERNRVLSERKVPHPHVCARWSSKSNRLVTGSSNGDVAMWGVSDNVLSQQSYFCAHRSAVTDIISLSTQNTLVTASADSNIAVLDPLGKVLRKITAHFGGVNTLSSDSRNHLVVSGGVDPTPLVWFATLQEGTRPFELRDQNASHRGGIVKVQCVPDRSQVFSLDVFGYVKVWDIRKYQCLETLRLLRDAGGAAVVGGTESNRNTNIWQSLCVVNDEVLLASCPDRIAVHTSQETTQSKHADFHPISHLLHNPTDSTLLSVAHSNVKMWGLQSGELQASYEGVTEDKVLSAALDPSAAKLFLGTTAGEVVAMQYSNGTAMPIAQPHEGGITSLTFIARGPILVSCGRDRRIVATCPTVPPKFPCVSFAENIAVTATEYSKPFEMLATATSDGKIILWDTSSFDTTVGLQRVQVVTLSHVVRVDKGAVVDIRAVCIIPSRSLMVVGETVTGVHVLSMGREYRRVGHYRSPKCHAPSCIFFFPSLKHLVVVDTEATVETLNVQPFFDSIDDGVPNVGELPVVRSYVAHSGRSLTAAMIMNEWSAVATCSVTMDCVLHDTLGRFLGRLDKSNASLNDWKVMLPQTRPRRMTRRGSMLQTSLSRMSSLASMKDSPTGQAARVQSMRGLTTTSSFVLRYQEDQYNREKSPERRMSLAGSGSMQRSSIIDPSTLDDDLPPQLIQIQPRHRAKFGKTGTPLVNSEFVEVDAGENIAEKVNVLSAGGSTVREVILNPNARLGTATSRVGMSSQPSSRPVSRLDNTMTSFGSTIPRGNSFGLGTIPPTIGEVSLRTRETPSLEATTKFTEDYPLEVEQSKLIPTVNMAIKAYNPPDKVLRAMTYFSDELFTSNHPQRSTVPLRSTSPRRLEGLGRPMDAGPRPLGRLVPARSHSTSPTASHRIRAPSRTPHANTPEPAGVPGWIKKRDTLPPLCGGFTRQTRMQ